MSDLQCPATFLVVGLGPVLREPEGVERVAGEGRGRPPELAGLAGLDGLAEGLRDRRIAVVCSGRDATALAAAKGLAGQLGVPHRSIDGLEPLPATPACADVALSAHHRAALDALADLHRGETVLVVTDASVLTALWPGTRSHDGEGALSPDRLVTVQVDGDGWRLLGRPGGG